MKTTFAALACLSLASLPFPAIAQQKDVDVFTEQDAEAVLADPASDCAVTLPNGECARTSATRGFRLADDKPAGSSKTTTAPKASSQPSRPSGSTSYVRPRTKQSAPVGASSRVGPAHEVPLQFTLGSYELSPQSKANLKNLSTALNSPTNVGKRIVIAGHTDRTGSLAVNKTLSQARADAVADYLASLGVDRSRMDTEGRAYSEPLSGVSAYDPRNRRVEVQRVE